MNSVQTLTTQPETNFVTLWKRTTGWVRGLQRALNGAAWGAVVGAGLGAMIAAGMQAWSWFTPFGQVIDILCGILMVLMVIAAAGGTAALVWYLAARAVGWLYARPQKSLRGLAVLPHFLFWLIPLPLVAGVAGILICSSLYSWFPNTLAYFVSIPSQGVPLVAIEAALAAGIGVALTFRARWWGVSLASLPFAAAQVALVAFILWPGVDSYLAEHPQVIAPAVRAQAPSLADPGLAGPYAVHSCTYGSGSDIRRPEYGAKVCWTAPSIDADRALLDYPKLANDYFTWFWGFGFDNLPLNGQVWAPRTEAGPAPLVFIVHGNHAMGDFSDGGYAYLGEHLASQGMIVVSVDENFLNGFFLKDMGKAENSVRAWMLLKHIQQWTAWNEDPTHPFYHRVDLSRVAVMGHSRGGETAGLAAAINLQESSPIVGLGETLNGFNIRAVVSIAPSEGSFRVNGSDAQIAGASYLLIQGAHDADAYMLNGIRQYQRVTLAPDGSNFKAAIYLYRADHSQFNSGWGQGDAHPSWLLNTKALLSPAQQQQEAKTFISAFLQAALLGREEYRAVFQQPWAALAQAAIPDVALGRYQDGSFLLLHAFEDYAITTANGAGVTVAATGFEQATLEILYTRDPGIRQNNTALRLNWTQPGAEFTLNLPAGLSEGARGVSFTAAPAEDEQPPLDLTVVLTDNNRRTALLALGDAAPLPMLLPAQLTKSPTVATALGLARDYPKAERFLQTVRLPFERFQGQPGFDPNSLAAITLRFDRLPAGQALIDEIGLTR